MSRLSGSVKVCTRALAMNSPLQRDVPQKQWGDIPFAVGTAKPIAGVCAAHCRRIVTSPVRCINCNSITMTMTNPGRSAARSIDAEAVTHLHQTSPARLRSAGVSKEDRKDLLGHKSRDVTTDYSAAELMSLVKAANLIIRSKDSPTLTVLRVAA